VNDVEIEGTDAFAWAVPHDPLFAYRIADGRWFTPQEERSRARVAVLERSIAQEAGAQVGESTVVETAAGPAAFRVVGISSNQQENGFVAFVPLTTLRSVLRSPGRVDTYWIKTTSADNGLIDRTATRLEDALVARGYEPGSEITYVATAENVARNRTMTTTITVLGFVIVAISLVGLVNAITMSVLERTREIGVLRCIGARARDVRRIFATEGLVLALLGWVLGIPLGYALDRALVWLLHQALDVDVGVVFPAWNVLVVLAGTLALTLLVLLMPIRRAVHLRPGEALRFA
jgi:ABC-type lipoprotein release transport system permease subunit